MFMGDQKRLELMQQMLSRLTGQAPGPIVPGPVEPTAPGNGQPLAFAKETQAQEPGQARLRALQAMLARLGK